MNCGSWSSFFYFYASSFLHNSAALVTSLYMVPRSGRNAFKPWDLPSGIVQSISISSYFAFFFLPPFLLGELEVALPFLPPDLAGDFSLEADFLASVLFSSFGLYLDLMDAMMSVNSRLTDSPTLLAE